MPNTVTKTPTMKLVKFYQISEVDEVAHVVYGIATGETPDCDGEICDYEDTVPLYKDWSEGTAEVTTAAGQEVSYGNIRLQHTNEIAGKVTKVDYDDAKKQIRIAAEPLNDTVWTMVKRGFVTGFSQGGKYMYRVCNKCGADCGEPGKFDCPSCKTKVNVRYACKPAEVSFVDRPCLGTAHFLFIKSNGKQEVRKFAPGKLAQMPITKAKTKRVAGEDLGSSAFAFVGDANDTSTWKLPIRFSTDAKTKSHIRNALSRFGQTQGIPDGERSKVHARIVSAARSHGIEVSEVNRGEEPVNVMKLSFKGLTAKIGDAAKRFPGVEKSMYGVRMLAGILSDLKYVEQSCRAEGAYEDDERDIALADEVVEAMKLLITTLSGMVSEEGSELLAAAKAAVSQGEEMNVTTVMKAARNALAGYLRKAANHHEAAADNHKAMANEYLACCETCKAAADDGPDDAKGHHKAMANHFKSLAAQHEKLHKAHAAQCDHCTKAATAEEEAATKIDNVTEITKVEAPAAAAAPVVEDPVKKAAEAEAVAKAAAAASTGSPVAGTPSVDVQSTVNTMINDAIKKAIEGSLGNLAGNDTIQKAVQDAVSAKVSEVLSGTVIPTGAKVAGPVLVPRVGEVAKATGTDDSCGL